MAVQLSVSSTNAGKRGRAWRCWECLYVGERHAVRKHVYENHIMISELPYYCGLCDNRRHHYPTFAKHVRWYQLRIERARGRPSSGSPRVPGLPAGRTEHFTHGAAVCIGFAGSLGVGFSQRCSLIQFYRLVDYRS